MSSSQIPPRDAVPPTPPGTKSKSGFVDYKDSAKSYDNARDPLGCDIIVGQMATVSKTGVPLSEQRVLDAGCGTGNYVTHIAPHVRLVDAFDFSDAMVQKAKAKFAGNPKVGDLRVGNCCNLEEVENDTYDAVFNNQVVQHLETPDTMEDKSNLKLCLSETFRVLKPGGVSIISTRSKEPEYHDLYWYSEFFPKAVAKMVAKVPGRELLKDLSEQAGFQFQEAYCPMFKSIMSMQHFLNPEGPFDKAWRRGESFWSLVSEEELQEGLKKIRSKIDDGSIQEFIERKEALRKANGQVLFIVATKPVL